MCPCWSKDVTEGWALSSQKSHTIHPQGALPSVYASMNAQLSLLSCLHSAIVDSLPSTVISVKQLHQSWYFITAIGR